MSLLFPVEFGPYTRFEQRIVRIMLTISNSLTSPLEKYRLSTTMKIIQLLSIFFALSSVQAIDNVEGGLRGLKSTKGESPSQRLQSEPYEYYCLVSL